jgi:hypothetical protein
MYKKVKIITQVPDGEFCFGYDAEGSFACPHFDSYGGPAVCEIGKLIDGPKLHYDERGRVLKPEACRNLVQVVGRQ